jgi:hypothetical protein
MKKIITAAAGVAMLVAAPVAAYAANDTMTATVTSAQSMSRQTSSEVNVSGTWETERLTVGQSFTVASVDGGFKWNASFPFTLDDGSQIGECTANEATLTCKVTTIPDAYANKKDVKGTWWARARLQDAAVGTTEGKISLNGEVVRTLVWGDKDATGKCSNDCSGPAHYEYASPENLKFGWTNANGTVGWGIKFIVEPGTEYTVKDFDTRLNTDVKCTESPTWDPKTTAFITAIPVDANTIKFTAPEGAEVCMVYPPEQVRVPDGQTSVTNHAEVNGVKLEATATVKANGGADGDGTAMTNPEPSPVPTPDVSAPSPAPVPSPEPKPSDKPQYDPTPAPVETTPVPVPSVSPSAPAPVEKPQGAQGGTQGKLAKTGATPAGLIGTGILVAGGVALAVARYKRR